jgi:hypothetical protein
LILLALVAGMLIHPLTHVADDGICPCVHAAAVTAAAPMLEEPGSAEARHETLVSVSVDRASGLDSARAPPAR